MTFGSEMVVAIASVAWSVGLFFGMLTSKFISKKECKEKNEQVWSRIDALQDCMTGGPFKFEVRLIPSKDS